MEFTEFQTLISKDDMFFEHIKRNVNSKRIRFSRGEFLIPHDGEVYFLNTGIFTRTSDCNVKFICEQKILIGSLYIKQKITINSLTSSYIYVFNQEELFNFLEKEGLLANFFFEILVEENNERKFLNELLSPSPKKRIQQFLLHSLKEESTNLYSLPLFLNIQMIAACCFCSRQLVSNYIVKLENQGIIDTSTKPWKILDLNGLKEEIDRTSSSKS
ncbi:Crp/Fnr family transcriptional regulator [Listeria sp. PSOL-1]|uniref:Crp/Fnr family transcriptional regulator n=1 Tax=Listeria sp. PSOL-1 TaxID=1844999 RepID=UPI0013D1857D|nr:helix-turn-helix domain-containing protein [Listeria sp. PSOL-1]